MRGRRTGLTDPFNDQLIRVELTLLGVHGMTPLKFDTFSGFLQSWIELFEVSK